MHIIFNYFKIAFANSIDQSVNPSIGQAGRGVQVPPYNGGISPLETPASLSVKKEAAQIS